MLGWIACAYLFYRAAQLNKGPTTELDLCNMLFGASCDGVLSNAASWQLGYPLAGWGLVYFGLLGLLLVINKSIVNQAIILLSSFGLGVSIIQGLYIISKGLSCPLCLGIHIINLVVLISIYLSAKPHIVISKQNQSTPLRLSMQWGVLLVLAVMTGGFSEVYILANSIGTSAEVRLNQSFEDFRNGAVYDFSKNTLSPKTGLSDAPLQLVVFSSFQCPGCQVFNHSLANIKSKFGKNINVEYKDFPLSSTCNSKLKVDMQPRSCDAAIAAIAASNQDRYWEYHEQLFQSDLQAKDSTLISIAQSVGLNMETWQSDRESQEVIDRLLEDIRLANEIGIRATPTVFLNGRRVNRFEETSLTYLLYEELNQLSN